MSTTISGFLGLDVERVQGLARLTADWHPRVEAVVGDLTAAETVLGYSVGVTGLLEQVALDGRAISAALTTAVQLVSIEHVMTTPRLALLLDLPVGVSVHRELVTAALTRGLTYRQAVIERELRAYTLRNPNPANRRAIDRLRAEFEAIDPDNRGDLGETLTTEIRDPYRAELDKTNFERGRAIVTHALADTVDHTQIRPDEFQVILHDNGNITVVLPGVIDLSPPDLGFNDRHESVRDTDKAAVPSFFSTGVAGNPYAKLVEEWFTDAVATGVISPGAPVLIVGHSFGAETAIDLAADPHFNGGLVEVTHVVAAGYHVAPHLDHVVNGTLVGVVQNSFDLVAQAERSVHTIVDVRSWGAGLFAPIWAVPIAAAQHRVVESIVSPDISSYGPGGFVAEFRGGVRGLGHHSDRYIEFLEQDEPDPLIVGFLASIGSTGFGGPGSSIAVDVSIRRRPRPAWNGPEPRPNPGPGPSTGAPAPTAPRPSAPPPSPSRTPVPDETPG